MDLYELIERTLTCRWMRGAYRKHFDIHYWPNTGFHTRPWLIMISPHEGKYSVIDYRENKTYTVGIDQVVLNVPGTPMQVYQHTPGTQTYAHLVYTMLGAFDPWSLFEMPRIYKGKNGDRVREALLYVAESYTAMEMSLQTIASRKESAYKLFGVLISLGKLRKEKTDLLNSYSRIQPVVSFIQENLSQPVQREDLAELAHLSPSRLNVVFKEIMGLAPKQYMQDLRHKKAVDLLQDTNLSISEVAEQCGFCDQFEFSRQFKKKWGSPPLAYRKALREQADFFG